MGVPFPLVASHSVQPEHLLGWLCSVGIPLRTECKEGGLLLRSGHWGQRVEIIVWGLAVMKEMCPRNSCVWRSGGLKRWPEHSRGKGRTGDLCHVLNPVCDRVPAP